MSDRLEPNASIFGKARGFPRKRASIDFMQMRPRERVDQAPMPPDAPPDHNDGVHHG